MSRDRKSKCFGPVASFQLALKGAILNASIIITCVLDMSLALLNSLYM